MPLRDGHSLSRQDVKFFRRAWQGLAETGACDELGGAEYRRVLQEWIAAKCPLPIEPLIRAAANRAAPETEEVAEQRWTVAEERWTVV